MTMCEIFGCRMFSCTCQTADEYENSDYFDDRMILSSEWCQDNCDNCRKKMPRPSYAKRYVCPTGGFLGCYHSEGCVREAVLEQNTGYIQRQKQETDRDSKGRPMSNNDLRCRDTDDEYIPEILLRRHRFKTRFQEIMLRIGVLDRDGIDSTPQNYKFDLRAEILVSDDVSQITDSLTKAYFGAGVKKRQKFNDSLIPGLMNFEQAFEQQLK